MDVSRTFSGPFLDVFKTSRTSDLHVLKTFLKRLCAIWEVRSDFLQFDSSLVASGRPTPLILARSSDSLFGSLRPIKTVLSLKLRQRVVLQPPLRPGPFLRVFPPLSAGGQGTLSEYIAYIGYVLYIHF